MTTMSKVRTARLQDTKVDVKVLLGGLWISMLFVFAGVAPCRWTVDQAASAV